MTPISATPDLIHVRDDLMRDTGNANMNATKYRDGARKPSGNIALTDFAGRCWTQGRNMVSTTNGTDPTTVKGHQWDMRLDNISHSSVTREVNDNGGLPKWSVYWKGRRDIPTAAYNCGFYKASTSRNVNTTLKIRANRWSGKNLYFSHCDISIYGYQSGYLSGGQMAVIASSTSMNYSGNLNTFTFTTDKRYPYIQIAPRVYCGEWNGVMGYDTYAAYEMYDIEVYET